MSASAIFIVTTPESRPSGTTQRGSGLGIAHCGGDLVHRVQWHTRFSTLAKARMSEVVEVKAWPAGLLPGGPPVPVKGGLRDALARGSGQDGSCSSRGSLGVQMLAQRGQQRGWDGDGARTVRLRRGERVRLDIELPTDVQNGSVGVVQVLEVSTFQPKDLAAEGRTTLRGAQRCAGGRAWPQSWPGPLREWPRLHARPRDGPYGCLGASGKTKPSRPPALALTAALRHERSAITTLGVMPLTLARG